MSLYDAKNFFLFIEKQKWKIRKELLTRMTRVSISITLYYMQKFTLKIKEITGTYFMLKTTNSGLSGRTTIDELLWVYEWIRTGFHRGIVYYSIEASFCHF